MSAEYPKKLVTVSTMGMAHIVDKVRDSVSSCEACNIMPHPPQAWGSLCHGLKPSIVSALVAAVAAYRLQGTCRAQISTGCGHR